MLNTESRVLPLAAGAIASLWFWQGEKRPIDEAGCSEELREIVELRHSLDWWRLLALWLSALLVLAVGLFCVLLGLVGGCCNLGAYCCGRRERALRESAALRAELEKRRQIIAEQHQAKTLGFSGHGRLAAR